MVSAIKSSSGESQAPVELSSPELLKQSLPSVMERTKTSLPEKTTLTDRSISPLSLTTGTGQFVDFALFLSEQKDELRKLKMQITEAKEEMKQRQFKTACLQMKATGISDGEILCNAVIKRDLEFLSFVLCGAKEDRMDINGVDKEGKAPLHHATYQEDKDLADFLLTHGANPDILEKQGLGNAAIHIAVKKENLEMVKCLAKWSADVTITQNIQFGYSPLHFASREGFYKIAKFLLNEGAEIDQCSLGDNLTAIYLAACNNNEALVSLLLKKGADISIVSTVGKSPLSIAKEKGFDNIVKILKNPPKVNKKAITTVSTKGISYDYLLAPFKSKEQDSIDLQKASEEGHLHKVIGLVERGASVNFQDSSRSHTIPALHKAAVKGFFKIVEYLVEHGADVNLEDVASGFTPLHYSSREDNFDITKLLVTKKALVNKCSMRHSYSALFLAARNNYKKIVSFLLENGADPYIIDLLGKTSLAIASEENHTEIIDILTEYQKSHPQSQAYMTQEDIPYTVCIETFNGSGSDRIALGNAIKEGHWQKVVQLMSRKKIKADKYTISSSERDVIAKYKWAKIGLLLLENGFVLETEKFDIVTPLHYTAEMNLTVDFCRLLNAGADHTLRSGGPFTFKSQRKTVREIATDNKNAEIVAILDEHEKKLMLTTPPKQSFLDSIRKKVLSSKKDKFSLTEEQTPLLELGDVGDKDEAISILHPLEILEPVYIPKETV